VVLPYYLFHLEKCVCLSHDVWVTGAALLATTRIEVGVGDLVQRTGIVKHRSGTRWLDDREVG
jgi:hypothetical protein